MQTVLTTGLAPFDTARLRIGDWSALLGDPSARLALMDGLARVLTPAVTAPLPPALQLHDAADAIPRWVAARAAECKPKISSTGFCRGKPKAAPGSPERRKMSQLGLRAGIGFGSIRI